MRIISGTHKGKQLFPDKNFKARPTTDFAKENLFNVLNNYIDIENIRALDLFSGTGSISYELASRGAEKIVSVEANYNHFSFIKKTALQLGFKNIAIYKTDAFIACKKLKEQHFGLIFADPPYDLPNITEIPAAIFDNDLLSPDGIAVIEHPATVDFSSFPHFLEHRQYGSVNFSLFRK
ncbi:RsmD family RNA methyltransferase [Gabonibacter chumensis]|uniref:RsmD family RNA methyltransferase n=1 Tax=Gabonibacter chumensis TaxID=2972474 RepID=UPI0025732F9F|nr:RsmD family RNA methyltransferase [Gabonibacter chumensis]MCR9011614.1 23S rRNA (adenine(2030)-N(6))-methyltransferase RlmJ [Gabonibacter chumensis]